MDEALLALLDKKDFDYITVKEICDKAGVNRSTFYLHYENTSELLAESVEYLIRNLRSRYGDSDLINVKNDSVDELLLFTPEYSVPYLQFIKEHKKAFTAAISQPNIFGVNNTFNKMYNLLFEPILEKFGVPQEERRYMVKFYISGIHAVITEWIKGGCTDEITHIADMIMKCVNHKH